jgi:hypothetical protein
LLNGTQACRSSSGHLERKAPAGHRRTNPKVLAAKADFDAHEEALKGRPAILNLRSRAPIGLAALNAPAILAGKPNRTLLKEEVRNV